QLATPERKSLRKKTTTLFSKKGRGLSAGNGHRKHSKGSEGSDGERTRRRRRERKKERADERACPKVSAVSNSKRLCKGNLRCN
ncbi:hypothetical protein NE477_25915, partial [Blautia marasmi]|uniref:hypothetical protein n=1 Tax=Blautia marasmi TaxID=1917868 RepID=UPI00210CFE25